MLITIITVVFNAGETIESAIESVLNQREQKFEYIIVDGQSTDGTIDIIKRYEKRLAYFVSEKDDGIYDAMNKAVLHAKGEWIYFLGADDVLYDNDVLESVSDRMVNHNEIYYGDVLLKHRSKVYDGKFNVIKLATRNISHQSIFYPRTVFEQFQYNTEYKIFADYHLNIILFNNHQFKFKYMPIIVAIFDDSGMSGSRIIDGNFEKDRLAIFKEYFPRYVYLYRRLRSLIKQLS